ncbi:FdhF/YdeP family oxidoreductase [Cognatishimia activa]|uniref:Formate dehydrogenase H n=1 Tax=Cognatishimia activa TaxID=1715691 RepID=A0A0P1ISZ8_9RHOB|nr:FdhF/YdeP family oxidoreductase [Cognatishimia activa]CUI74826.1 Formate dehydrogenase H [Cognatishimia activa]CUK26689.1 Formate dehydrogenase H [Cognatishimia activa]
MAKDNCERKPSKAAGGWGALKSVARQLKNSGKPVSGAKTLLSLNQADGFDCPGCAWGDPEHGSSFEFCENGVKAVTWEATKNRVTPEFFAAHSVQELRTWSDHDLEHQGRLTNPMRYNPETDHYEAVSWEDAFAGIGAALNAIEDPNQAEFYTSGRASNEAAFLYQTFVRLFGTNNFPDCSNMCHEASGVALTQAIGIGKGTILLEDFDETDLVYCVGQNPGTNHPRMLASLREVVERGAKVVAINPLKEKGLTRFADPQNKIEMIRGTSAPTSTHYISPRLGGDMAIFRGMSKVVLEAEDKAQAEGKPAVLDHAFIAEHTHGFDAWCDLVRATSWDQILDQSGLTREDIETAAQMYIDADRVIVAWAMGITQHVHSVDTIREIASFMFLKGNVGRKGTGLCPVRGHSNVQGDRTVGINEKAPAAFIDAMEAELGVSLPRERGHNVIQAIGAMLDGTAKAFIALGGNFARAVPDSHLVAEAMGKLDLTVNIATKLNHGHLMPGKQSYVLPCLGRTEIDKNLEGTRQMVTVEDSMSMVHGSSGINLPASKSLLSEVRIIAGIAKATVGSERVDWDTLGQDHDKIREMIARVLPIFGDFNKQVREPRGFWLRNPASEREFRTPTAKANFGDADLPALTEWQSVNGKDAHFVLQTFRSHDQYNTTVYGMDDRYRGIYGEREVVFVNKRDLKAMDLKGGDIVDIIGTYEDGHRRECKGFRVVEYDTPRGCIGGYYPEMNALVPHQTVGDLSFTPTSKSVLVRLEKSNP